MNYLKTFLPHLFGNKEGKSFVLPSDIAWDTLKFEELLMFHTLKNNLGVFLNTLSISELSSSQIYHLFSFSKFLPREFLADLKLQYASEYQLFVKAKDGDVLNAEDLQELLKFKNYELSVFAIFSKDRLRPGRLFVRDYHGKFVHDKKGAVWSIPVLGVSGRGLAFHHSNGSTPCGVYTINSVMPLADNVAEFGKYRRLKVDFIPKSEHEESILQQLPRTQHQRHWWYQCLVGRELGRSLLRIHGTGAVNKNPFSPHFPMIPSSGCLTTTERNYMGLFKIDHQRELLDTLMKASDLPATQENESKIHGVLYVVEFDDTYQALEFKS